MTIPSDIILYGTMKANAFNFYIDKLKRDLTYVATYKFEIEELELLEILENSIKHSREQLIRTLGGEAPPYLADILYGGYIIKR